MDINLIVLLFHAITTVFLLYFNIIYIAPDPASSYQALYMTNIQENKLHLIQSRFKQMCLEVFLKAQRANCHLLSEKNAGLAKLETEKLEDLNDLISTLVVPPRQTLKLTDHI